MKKARAIYISRHSAGLDDLTRVQQRDPVAVLKRLHEIKRFSVFEATENQWIASTMTMLVNRKLIEVDNSPGFPWSKVELTAEGLKMIKE